PDQRQARRGSIAAAFFKLLPVFIFIIPGMIAFALAKSGQNAALQQELFGGGTELIRANAQKAFPMLVANILPVGVRGMVVAGLLAALMSSLAGAFNAAATLFTMDFYQRLRPKVTQERLVWIGRVATGVMVLIGLLWIPVIRGGRGLYDYLQGVQSYLAPPIFVVFFFGVFWKRLNAKGCLAALGTGFALGLFRLAVDTPVKLASGFSYAEGSFLWIVNHIPVKLASGFSYAEGSFLWIVNHIFFQYYSLVIFIVSALVMIVVSYLTAQPDYAKISGLTYGTVTAEQKRETRASWQARDIVASAIVLALIIGAYLYFTG
ncbi:MAG: Na+/glucose cotransporter, partial [Candidatus Aminicenantes bacterium]|nr:Na+/glucose cotransporter [Candidatus Aminicenantes bacterium]